MKLTEEQILKLQLMETQTRLNNASMRILEYANNDIFLNKEKEINKWALEAREKENKPEDKFTCSLDLNTLEFVFTEKEEKDAT